jgi:hypothetical protein
MTDDDWESHLLAEQMFDPPVRGGTMIRGRPILSIPESETKYTDFLAWWKQVGRLRPSDLQGWGSISGPHVRRGRVELIDELSWVALPQEERNLIKAWVDTIPIQCFYD